MSGMRNRQRPQRVEKIRRVAQIWCWLKIGTADLLRVVGRNWKIAVHSMRECMSGAHGATKASLSNRAPIHNTCAGTLLRHVHQSIIIFMAHCCTTDIYRKQNEWESTQKCAVGCGCRGENVFVICCCAASWEINILTSVPKASTRAAQWMGFQQQWRRRRNHPLLITPLTAVRVSIWDAAEKRVCVRCA